MKKKRIQTVCAIGIFLTVGAPLADLAEAVEPEEPSVTVMSYNIFRGGTMREQPLSQTARGDSGGKGRYCRRSGNAFPYGDNAEKLAQLLGWNLHVGLGINAS